MSELKKMAQQSNDAHLKHREEPFDVCIVGSGAGGGMAAHVLTQAGARVVMLEAGDLWDNRTDSAMLVPLASSLRRGMGTRERPYGEFTAFIGGREIDGEPYTTSEGTRFDWWRARMLGGRTNVWGRIALRFGADDFKRRSLDGLGDDWPISYEELAPYYDGLDRLAGVFGSVEGLPNDPDGIFLPPPAPRCHEQLVRNACDQLGVRCIPSRIAVLTRTHNGRAACGYCGECARGCRLNANFSSPNVLIEPALRSGRLTLLTGAMARHVTVNASGHASGVTYVQKTDGEHRHVRARIVVLAASACESARLLLNSKSSLHANGLANSSGVVGRYLTDTVCTDVAGVVPALVNHVPHDDRGVIGGHIYIPWWLDNRALDFPRGYHLEVTSDRKPPSAGSVPAQSTSRIFYGARLKEMQRRQLGTVIRLSGRGEMIPNVDSYCELDPTVVDQWGIPVLRFNWKWSDHERRLIKHTRATARSILQTLGANVPADEVELEGLMGQPGSANHEVGCVRMGHDASRSVLNAYGRAHDVRNLFVADGGSFVSHPNKNPTWTIMALAWRTSDHIVEAMRDRSL